MCPLPLCPSQQQLSDYVLGKLNEADSDSVANHLLECDTCQSRVDEVEESADSIVHKLRHPTPDDEFMNEPQCQMAVADARQLAREPDVDLRLLRDYQLIEKLGEGGMGAVYSAIHTKLEKSVAVKLLSADRMWSADAISRFEREMKAIGKLHHPNIVQALDAGESDGKHYLVMELVEGFDASALVQRLGPLPVAEACDIVRQAAVGLEHAHERGLVHRDIKPSNIMVTPAGEVKILDLGLARVDDAILDGELTSTGQIMGTLDYMAPEQLGDSHAVDHRADIYSLGAALYKLLTGHAPHADKRYKTPQKKLMAIATKPVLPVAEFRADVPPKVVAALSRMLEKDPDERFQAASEVASALEDFCKLADPSKLVAEARQADNASHDSEVTTDSTVDPVKSSFTDTQSTMVTPPPVSARLHRRSVPPAWLAGTVTLFFLVVLASTFFWVNMGEATLVVEIDDDVEMEAVVKKGAIVIKDLKNGRTWNISLGERTKLDAGEYRLLITDESGLEVFSDEFTLRRGEREVAKVSFVRGTRDTIEDRVDRDTQHQEWWRALR